MDARTKQNGGVLALLRFGLQYLIMFHPRRSLAVSAWLLTAIALLSISFAQSKRPLNHTDYDGWRAIVGAAAFQ